MDDLLDVLAAWMPRQRWYGGKGRTPRLTLVAAWDLDGPHVRLVLVQDGAASPAAIYQVPLVVRDAASADPATTVGPAGEGLVWVDATTDAAFTDVLYRWVTVGAQTGAGAETLVGRPLSDAATTTTVTARVLSGEQSNTSIIFRPVGDGIPVICKVFRLVNPGVNPDVELQTALAASGAAFVPASIGEVHGTWRDPATGAAVGGSLAFAQQFFEGVEDAWRVALRAAVAGEDFTERARSLGAAVGHMHLSLAESFPTTPSHAADRAAVAGAWERRLTIALGEVPALAPHAERIRAVYAAADGAPWPALQRVHGDLHLGQVLDTPSQGWVLLDFEGEPLRPIAERLLPDVAARDVAGMLRSFDYVSGAVEGVDPLAVRRWVVDAQEAFLAGYVEAVGPDRAAADALLAAFELDKAVYEAIYETRNRPGWVGIPLAAIGRLIGEPV